MKERLFIDFEVSSPLDIKKVGTANSIIAGEPTWVAWASDDNPVEVRRWSDEAHADLAMEVLGHSYVAAHGATYDLMVLRYHDADLYKMVLDGKLECTMSMARYLGLPAALADLAEVFGLEPKRSIDMSSQGDLLNEPTDEDWEEYVKHDVVLLREVYERLAKRIAPNEFRLIDLHLRMQTRGVKVDAKRLNELGKEANKGMTEIDAAFGKLTGYTPTQTKRLGEWFRQECGVGSASTKKLETAYYEDHSKWTERGMKAYELLMRRKGNELAKLRKIRETMTGDAILSDTLKHAATVTNRWSGKGAHFHNAAREGSVRTIVIPHGGKTFVRADLSQIEVRCGLWLAGMKDAMQNLHESDWYLQLTEDIYGKQDDPDQRKRLRHGVKQGVIGAMYSGGAEAVRRAIGPKATIEEAAFVLEESKKRMGTAVRAKSDELFKAWEDVARNGKAGHCTHVAVGVGGGENVTIGKPYVGIASSDDDILLVSCGRSRLVYWNARQAKDGTWEYDVGNRTKYMQHRGTFYENLASTIAREVLVSGLLRINSVEGLTPVYTIHDEVLVEVDERMQDKKPAGHVRSAMIMPVAGFKGLLIDSEAEERSAWKEIK